MVTPSSRCYGAPMIGLAGMLLAVAVTSEGRAQPTFTILVPTPGSLISGAADMTDDGTTIVGSMGNAAYRWQDGVGAYLSHPSVPSYAVGVSGDGSVICATSGSTTANAQVWRWTTGTGWQNLGNLGYSGIWTTGISRNGEIIVGTGRLPPGSYYMGFRWTPGGGMQSLGDLGGGYSRANGISPNGEYIVGYSWDSAGNTRATRWSAQGIENLGTLPGFDGSEANDVSDNGVSVGYGYAGSPSTGNYHAVRWIGTQEIQDLGTLGGLQARAHKVSTDGTVVLGKSWLSGGTQERAFMWTESLGMVNLHTYLAGQGVAMQSYALMSAHWISDDKTTILGQARWNGTGNSVAFVVRGLLLSQPCYANCDGSTAAPVLNVADFTCFLQRYAAGESYANCDQSTSAPVLNVADFTCFLQRYAAGCP
jgi:probable HAF family extracellular repeat protein